MDPEWVLSIFYVFAWRSADRSLSPSTRSLSPSTPLSFPPPSPRPISPSLSTLALSLPRSLPLSLPLSQPSPSLSPFLSPPPPTPLHQSLKKKELFTSDGKTLHCDVMQKLDILSLQVT